jgi:hypothetical protein
LNLGVQPSDFQPRLPRPPGDGFNGHGFQHFLVHISQLFDVDAALASGVFAEFGSIASESPSPYKAVAALRGEKAISGMSPSRPLS